MIGSAIQTRAFSCRARPPDMPAPHCVLYTFVKQNAEDEVDAAKLVAVARVTAKRQEDWYLWADRYCEQHPNLRPEQIVRIIEFVDERHEAA